MAQADHADSDKLKIIHCFRSPVGGIFRHVRDLIHEQSAQGHEIGVICDSNTGGTYEDGMLHELEPYLKLGLLRLPMNRNIGPRDLQVMWKLFIQLKGLNIDVLHSHGAKGGAYARLIGSLLKRSKKRPVRLYCPHGGSIHYDQSKPSGKFLFSLERFLERFTDRLVFVSQYERDGFFAKVGKAHCPHSLVRNGLTPDEFKPVETQKDATDFVYIGMMRDLKGVDLFLDALPLVSKQLKRPVTATLVGDGPHLEQYLARAKQFDENVEVTFYDPMPARDAFGKGHIMVVPSRAESMPYIILEALAAARPVIATKVGGIPEIYGEYSGVLVEPDSLEHLSKSMAGVAQGTIRLPPSDKMVERIFSNFSARVMASDVMDAYEATLSD